MAVDSSPSILRSRVSGFESTFAVASQLESASARRRGRSADAFSHSRAICTHDGGLIGASGGDDCALSLLIENFGGQRQRDRGLASLSRRRPSTACEDRRK